MKYDYFLMLLNELFDFQALKLDAQYLFKVVNEHLYSSYPNYLAMLREVSPQIEMQVVAVGQKFRLQYQSMMQQGGTAFAQNAHLQERLKAAMGYFETKLHELLDPVVVASKVTINNKQVITQYNNALDAFMLSYKLKVGIFARLKGDGFTIREYLNAKAKAALDEVKVEEGKPKKAKLPDGNEEKPKKAKVDTRAVTFKMFREGKSILDISKERSLSRGTIENHLAYYVENGKMKVEEIVSAQHQNIIRGIVRSFDKAYSLTDVKNRLQDNFTYAEIKLVIADMNKK
jgi:hypothetical protein